MAKRKKKEYWRIVKTPQGFRWTNGKEYKLRKPSGKISPKPGGHQLAPGVTAEEAAEMDRVQTQRKFERDQTAALNRQIATKRAISKAGADVKRGVEAAGQGIQEGFDYLVEGTKSNLLKIKENAEKRAEQAQFEAEYQGRRLQRGMLAAEEFLTQSPTDKMKEFQRVTAQHTGQLGPTLYDLMPSNPALKTQPKKHQTTYVANGVTYDAATNQPVQTQAQPQVLNQGKAAIDQVRAEVQGRRAFGNEWGSVKAQKADLGPQQGGLTYSQFQQQRGVQAPSQPTYQASSQPTYQQPSYQAPTSQPTYQAPKYGSAYQSSSPFPSSRQASPMSQPAQPAAPSPSSRKADFNRQYDQARQTMNTEELEKFGRQLHSQYFGKG